MMINLIPGITSSVWMSLREDLPYGSTASFVMSLTNDVTGAQKSFTINDLQPDNKWSRFNLCAATPENLSTGRLNLVSGMWSYKVTADTAILETGKVIVEEAKTWAVLDRPAKNNGALRR